MTSTSCASCGRQRGYKRLRVAAGVLAGAMFATLSGAAFAADGGAVTILSLGGSYQENQSRHWFRPFETETGIKVAEAAGYNFAKLKVMIESGNTEADLADVSADTAKALHDAGLLEEIEWDKVPESCKAGIPADMQLEYAFPTIQWAMVMAYNKNKFPAGKAPQTWADFWDTEKFPGKRGSIGATRPPVEMAALAIDGDLEGLYPIDIPASFQKIRELGGNLVFAEGYAQVAQYLADGEVDMIVIPNGRMVPLIESGRPVEINWNQHLRYPNFFAILKGASNKDNAMKFLAWVCQPEILAKLAKPTNYGPINTDAYKFIDEDTAPLLPGNPATAHLGRVSDAAWIGQNRSEIAREWARLSVR